VHEREERDDAGRQADGQLEGEVAGVAACQQPVGGAGDEEHVAGPVDVTPEPPGEPAHEQGRDLDREQEPQGHDSEGDCPRSPARSERDGHVGEPEVQVAVADDAADVHGGEHHGEAAEEAMEVQQPARRRSPAQQPGRQQQSPDHRGAVRSCQGSKVLAAASRRLR
jgi:hypothetical protein